MLWGVPTLCVCVCACACACVYVHVRISMCGCVCMRDEDASIVSLLNLLDVSSHLYKWVCASIHWLVCLLVSQSVHNTFMKIAENGVMQDEEASYVLFIHIFYSYIPIKDWSV